VNDGAAVTLTDLRFGWPGGPPVLAIDELHIGRGERVFVSGASGSGKSTLLGLVGGVLQPDSGRVVVLDQDLAALSTAGRDRFRADQVGFVFQMFNLLPYLSVLDNVLLPCRFSAARARRAAGAPGGTTGEARRLLSSLGLGDGELQQRNVTRLSIGQQQRVAAARALIGGPALVIADEPTSSLDSDARTGFIELLLAECRTAGSTVLFVSHDQSLARHFDRRVALGELNRVLADA
jgi:putative ABC transport system ATP-binding protein